MSPCLRERTLWEVHQGEHASPATTAHLATCSRCAARYARLGRDLAVIGEALQASAVTTAGDHALPNVTRLEGVSERASRERRTPHRRSRRLAIAASLAAVLALAAVHAWRDRAAPRPPAVALAESLVFLDEISVTLWSPDGGVIADLADPVNGPLNSLDGESSEAREDALPALSTDRGVARSAS
jgi:hypothetical protein